MITCHKTSKPSLILMTQKFLIYIPLMLLFEDNLLIADEQGCLSGRKVVILYNQW